MTLLTSDVLSIAKSLSYWEIAEYVSASLVAVGCIGEALAEFTNAFTGGVEARKERLRKCSTFLLIAALALEVVCLVQTNRLSGKLIGSLGEEAGEADSKAKTALVDSSSALAQSEAAEQSSSVARAESGKAVTSASSSLVLARDARREADSFERDIVSAKTQAANAESHLAEALHQSADATAELKRIKSPRALNNIPELVSTLEAFKDTEYTFISVCAEQECIQLLQQVDLNLRGAGWKQTKPPHAYPSINVFGSTVDFAVPVSLSTGVEISVESPESLSELQALPLANLPQYIRAGIALNLSLSSNLFPPQDSRTVVNVKPGTSTIIQIAIGKKP